MTNRIFKDKGQSLPSERFQWTKARRQNDLTNVVQSRRPDVPAKAPSLVRDAAGPTDVAEDEKPVSRPVQNRPRGTSERWEGARSIPKERVKELHQHDRTPTSKMLIDTSLLIASAVAGVVAWHNGYYAVTVVFWAIGGFLGNIKPLAFHDAAHGTLHPSPRKNELIGFGIATSIMVPMSLYRYAHAKHHSHIATEQDPELWPFTVTTTPRWQRHLVAFMELVFGFVVTPILFLRAFLIAEDIAPKVRRRIRIEYAGVSAFWFALISLTAWTGLWTELIVGIIMPWAVAGFLQTGNKYVEHMGMTGVGVMGTSRSVIPQDKFGEAVAAAWQNVAHHAAHHLYAKIPHYKLPEASEHIVSDTPPDGAIFPTYTAATIAMIKTLGDPKVGQQWNDV